MPQARLELVMAPVLAPTWPFSLASCCAPLPGLINILRDFKGQRSKVPICDAAGTTCGAVVSNSASACCCLPTVQQQGCQRQHRQQQEQDREQEGGQAQSLDANDHTSTSLSGMTAVDFQHALKEVVSAMQPWDDGAFAFVQTLQDASRNFGRVDLMTRRSEATADDSDQGSGEDCSPGYFANENTADGNQHFEKVAVKRMPKHWVGAGPEDFNRKHFDAAERPWDDLGFLKWLNDLQFPHVCSLHGVFADAENLYVVSSLAVQGDLFAWTFQTPGHGHDREARIRPLAKQAVSAVRWLHDLGIGHRDLSLENLVLEDLGGGSSRVKVIDFAMATLLRPCSGIVGKRSYQPPEVHTSAAYDPFTVDVFALGVTFFTMATQSYPWSSTRSGKCALFRHASTHGFLRYLSVRKLRKGDSLRLAEVFSPTFCELLSGLLEFKPLERLCLGEVCFPKCRRSVWELPWWEGHGGAEAS
mmetsp:Transcript_126896/g.317110  ORF Transcript_126896/g.317110 Transcript_126896/m.317110 type:complete len:473 (+) Transcript_126896:57-1475(+)